jgi:FAD-dependent oxidoreductase domain-containing protein 1
MMPAIHLQHPLSRQPRCVIVGGGVIGASVACFLVNHPGFDGSVVVLESDPSYRNGSTTRSAGGIRHQFSTRENILISRFATDFIRDPQRFIETRQTGADLGFVENGYLMLASAAGASTLRSNVALQRELGSDIELLDATRLAREFPWIHSGDIALASHGRSGEGWIDPHSLLMLFRQAATDRGAQFLKSTVNGFDRSGDRLTAATTVEGIKFQADVFVNAAGPAATSLYRLASCSPLPVHSRKRMVFVFHCRERIERCPLVVDPEGVYFRPEGEQFICGLSPPAEEDPDSDDFDIDHDWFESRIWPRLAHRVKAFEAIKVTGAWAGHYAYNTFDQNALIGQHPELSNFYLANGFSGHGLQQSPAVGRGIAELIVDGRFTQIDLSVFSPGRIAANQPLVERNVV